MAIYKGDKATRGDITPPRQEANKSDLCGSVGHSRPKGGATAYFSENS